MPFPWIFWLFGAFILALRHHAPDGSDHLLVARLPAGGPDQALHRHRRPGRTVIALVPIVPMALAMRTPEELEREIAERKRAEEACSPERRAGFRGARLRDIGIWEIDMPHGIVRERFLRGFQRDILGDQFGYARAGAPRPDLRDAMGTGHPDDLAEQSRAEPRRIAAERVPVHAGEASTMRTRTARPSGCSRHASRSSTTRRDGASHA